MSTFKVFPFVFLSLLCVAASSAINLISLWLKDIQRLTELEKKTMHSELEQLKSQINPHFLFNRRNTASVLTQKDPKKASVVLLRLCDLLRYQLYDSARNRVLLSSEIYFLEDFSISKKSEKFIMNDEL